jgi:hypothetical protein
VNGHGINDLTYSQSCSQRLPRDSPGETYINLSSLSTSTRPDAGEVPSGIESLYDTVLALLQSQVPQAAADGAIVPLFAMVNASHLRAWSGRLAPSAPRVPSPMGIEVTMGASTAREKAIVPNHCLYVSTAP